MYVCTAGDDHLYVHVKYFSMLESCVVMEAENIGVVADTNLMIDQHRSGGLQVISEKITAVNLAEDYGSCVTCASKVTETGSLAKCNTCGAIMKSEWCGHGEVVRVDFKQENGRKEHL